MKKLILSFVLMFGLAGLSFGGITGARQSEADFQSANVGANVSVSTLTWTAVPSTASIDSSRIGILVSNYGTNTGSFLLVMSTYSPITTAITIGQTLRNTDAAVTFSISRNVFLWAISLHTSAENIFYSELK